MLSLAQTLERPYALFAAGESAVNEALQAHTMLTATQRQAVQQAAHAPVMLLTGAAGCGKTYTTQVTRCGFL